MTKCWAMSLILPLAAAAMPADAALLTYTITGPYNASFTIDDHPTVLQDPSDANAFFIFDVFGTFGTHSGLGGLTFYSLIEEGGLTVTFLNPDTNSYDLANLTGNQLFSGPTDAPVLLPFGPTVFGNYDDPATSFVMSAVFADAAVPEPASWALMVGGMLAVGMRMRRRPTVSFA